MRVVAAEKGRSVGKVDHAAPSATLTLMHGLSGAATSGDGRQAGVGTTISRQSVQGTIQLQ